MYKRNKTCMKDINLDRILSYRQKTYRKNMLELVHEGLLDKTLVELANRMNIF